MQLSRKNDSQLPLGQHILLNMGVVPSTHGALPNLAAMANVGFIWIACKSSRVDDTCNMSKVAHLIRVRANLPREFALVVGVFAEAL